MPASTISYTVLFVEATAFAVIPLTVIDAGLSLTGALNTITILSPATTPGFPLLFTIVADISVAVTSADASSRFPTTVAEVVSKTTPSFVLIASLVVYVITVPLARFAVGLIVNS